MVVLRKNWTKDLPIFRAWFCEHDWDASLEKELNQGPPDLQSRHELNQGSPDLQSYCIEKKLNQGPPDLRIDMLTNALNEN